MNLTHSLLTFAFAFSLANSAFAETGGVAKVVILKGSVKAKFADGTMIDVKADQSIPEGAVIQTADKSFVKLIFIDKSQMNLGPNSQMIINAFPKKEAGIITLVKGQLRSQVTKDYMDMDDKSKSKLYIKTKTAAMGIRGTDFQVNFNAENQNTALITFEGKVAMAHIEKGAREEKFDQGKLEKVVSSDKAVLVTHGQISAVNLNVAERAMAPTLLGAKQIDALKENETGVKESTEGEKKQYRNPIPPGAESAAFSNVNDKLVDPSASKEAQKSEPSGFFNAKTGEYKLPAGSIIDLNTVNIIPPPANAVFDPNTKTFVVPESFGKIDKSTGEYKAPDGLKLGTDGKFILVDAVAYAKTQVINKEEKKEDKKEDDKKSDKKDDKKEDKKEDNKTSDTGAPAKTDSARAPASSEASPPPPPPGGMSGPAPSSINIPQPLASSAAMANFVNTFSPSAPMLPPPPPKIDAAAIINQNTQAHDTSTNLGTTNPNSHVHFIFNAQ